MQHGSQERVPRESVQESNISFTLSLLSGRQASQLIGQMFIFSHCVPPYSSPHAHLTSATSSSNLKWYLSFRWCLLTFFSFRLCSPAPVTFKMLLSVSVTFIEILSFNSPSIFVQLQQIHFSSLQWPLTLDQWYQLVRWTLSLWSWQCDNNMKKT